MVGVSADNSQTQKDLGEKRVIRDDDDVNKLISFKNYALLNETPRNLYIYQLMM